MKKNLHSADTMFVLLLFALFIITALFVTVSGAIAYRNSVVQMDERFNKQTCINYITAKVRANNDADKITLGELDGINTLCINDTIDGINYVTYIYQYDGAIRELFCNAEISLPPSSGSALTEAKAISFAKEGSLLEITLTDNEDKTTLFYINAL
ncbi:MAG: DUF4860 domain-containing protein [Ruminococcaceae bacterium]|nr:DUF4860 domain-containing protein [Oscillospiraceae bacterium]MBD5117068.1 DUF4860 domain-containing protein [Oscillospiraceae bacterium]